VQRAIRQIKIHQNKAVYADRRQKPVKEINEDTTVEDAALERQANQTIVFRCHCDRN
jgi:hypothetical protein